MENKKNPITLEQYMQLKVQLIISGMGGPTWAIFLVSMCLICVGCIVAALAINGWFIILFIISGVIFHEAVETTKKTTKKNKETVEILSKCLQNNETYEGTLKKLGLMKAGNPGKNIKYIEVLRFAYLFF